MRILKNEVGECCEIRLLWSKDNSRLCLYYLRNRFSFCLVDSLYLQWTGSCVYKTSSTGYVLFLIFPYLMKANMNLWLIHL